MNGSKLSLLNRKDHIAYIAGRTSTLAAPNADITRAEVAAILYRLLTPEAKSAYGTNINRFKDVPADAWYITAVSTLTNLGVITGYQDGTFGPQRSITRAELATILARFCDANGSAAALDRFTDISGSWARKYINQAAAAGLVYGYTDGTFRPDQNITRAETIVIVNRILGRSASADTVVNGYNIKGTSDTWAACPALVTPQTRDAPQKPVSQGKREVLRDWPGQLSHLPSPSVGIAPPHQGGLTYSRAGG